MANPLGQCTIGLTSIAGEHYVQPDGGVAAAVAEISGTLNAILVFSGASDAVCSDSGALVRCAVFSGVTAALGGISGSIVREAQFSGDVVAVAGVSGHLRGSFLFRGAAAADTEVSGSMLARRGFSGDVSADAGCSGSLGRTLILWGGEAVAAASATARRFVLIRLGAAWIIDMEVEPTWPLIDFADESLYPQIVVSEEVMPTPTNTISIPATW